MRRRSFISAFLAFAILVPALALAQLSRTETHEFPLEADGTVYLNSYKGSVAVSTWNEPSVRVIARIEPDGASMDAAENVECTEIELDQDPSKLEIRTSASSGFFASLNPFSDDAREKTLVHYEIRMPKTAQLIIEDHASAIDVRKIASNVSIETEEGSVMARDIRGKLSLETESGRFDVAGLDGSLDLETESGKGDIRFANLRGKTEVDNESGDVALYIPNNSGFEIDAYVHTNGTLETGMPVSERMAMRTSSDEERVRGKVNGGGPIVALYTEDGSIRLRRR